MLPSELYCAVLSPNNAEPDHIHAPPCLYAVSVDTSVSLVSINCTFLRCRCQMQCTLYNIEIGTSPQLAVLSADIQINTDMHIYTDICIDIYVY